MELERRAREARERAEGNRLKAATAKHVMAVWNVALAAGWRTVFTPSIGTALATGCHWLHVVCPACQQLGETDGFTWRLGSRTECKETPPRSDVNPAGRGDHSARLEFVVDMVTAMQQPTCFGDLPPRKLAASLRWLSRDLHTAPQFAEWSSEALDMRAVLGCTDDAQQD